MDVLWRDFEEQKEEENIPLECPDLFRLDNQWVLTAGYCGHVDGHGRKNSIYYHIGEWYQDQFHEEARGLYDFGADFYAVQTIDTETGRVAVGWISDVAKEHVKSPNGACGSMSIPRVLHIKDGKLYQNPVQGIYRRLSATRSTKDAGRTWRLPELRATPTMSN